MLEMTEVGPPTVLQEPADSVERVSQETDEEKRM